MSFEPDLVVGVRFNDSLLTVNAYVYRGNAVCLIMHHTYAYSPNRTYRTRNVKSRGTKTAFFNPTARVNNAHTRPGIYTL